MRDDVAERPKRAATQAQLANGGPMSSIQSTRTLQAERDGDVDQSSLISGPAGRVVTRLSCSGDTPTGLGLTPLRTPRESFPQCGT